jgi:hypothetical protein
MMKTQILEGGLHDILEALPLHANKFLDTLAKNYNTVFLRFHHSLQQDDLLHDGFVHNKTARQTYD